MYDRKSALHRMKIAEGHLKKVIKMIEEEAYCIDTINQLLAVQNSLKKIEESILSDHLKTCVVEKIKDGKTKEATKEVMEVFKRR